jgi:hypothetical protein
MKRQSLGLAALLCLSISSAWSQDKPPTDEQKKRAEELKKQIADKKVELAKLEAELLKLTPRPVLLGDWETVEQQLHDGTVRKGKEIAFRAFRFEKNSASILLKEVKAGEATKPKDSTQWLYIFEDGKVPATIIFLSKGEDGKYTPYHHCLCRVDGDHLLIAMKNYTFPKSFEPEEGMTIYKLKKK